MVDEIKLPTIVPSVPAAGRINKVKRREGHVQGDRFERHLNEEQRKEEQTEDEQETDLERIKLKREPLAPGDSGADNENHDDDMNNDQGRLVDVVI